MDARKFLILLLISFFTFILFFALQKNKQDDAYIFYTYAQNIAEGNGYVFNEGEKINGTSSPIYTLLVAFVYLFIKGISAGADVPLAGELITALGIWLSAYALYMIFMLLRKERLALLAPLFFLTNPLLRNGAGMEIFLMLALLLWGLYFFLSDKINLSAFLLALTSLTRGDTLIFIAVLLLWYIYKNKKFIPLSALLIYVLITSSWFLFSWYYFGELLPTTIAIKMNQGATGYFGTGFIFIKGFSRIFPGGAPFAFTFISLAVLSLAFLLKRDRKIFSNPAYVILLSWLAVHFIVYAFVLNTPPYPWYYVPYVIFFALLFSAAADEIYLMVNRRRIILLIPVIVFITGIILPVKMIFSPYNSKYRLYTVAADWLNKNVEEGSSVLVDEIGIIGYHYNKGRIIDVFGLINPEAAVKLQEGDPNWAIKHYKPDYVLSDYPAVHVYLNVKEGILQTVYKEQIVIGSDLEAVIYKKEKEF
jgi:arabinofuranosyltransferase